jgi:hypothetical protein
VGAAVGAERFGVPQRPGVGGRAERGAQVAAEPGDRVRVEQFGGVLDPGVEAVGGLHEFEGQVEDGVFAPQRVRCDPQVAEAGALPAVQVLEDHGGLHQRRCGAVPLVQYGVHDGVEGHVGVVEVGQHAVLDVVEQLPEGPGLVHPAAQGHGVDEEADRVAQPRVVPAGHDRADDHVVGAGPAGQHQPDAGDEHHEEVGTPLVSGLPHRVGRGPGDAEGVRAAARAAHRRARPVGGQVQGLGPGEPGPPVLQ